MNVKITVDYENGCYNIAGIRGETVHTERKPIRGIDKDIQYKASYSSSIRKMRRRELIRRAERLKAKDPSFKYTEKSLKNVDELMFKTLKDWDNMAHTDYANSYLKIASKVIDRKDFPKMSRKDFKRKCIRIRRRELNNLGINISYNVGLLNTSSSLTFLDKIKGMLIARRQSKVLGVRTYSSLYLKKARYVKDIDILEEQLEASRRAEDEYSLDEAKLDEIMDYIMRHPPKTNYDGNFENDQIELETELWDPSHIVLADTEVPIQEESVPNEQLPKEPVQKEPEQVIHEAEVVQEGTTQEEVKKEEIKQEISEPKKVESRNLTGGNRRRAIEKLQRQQNRTAQNSNKGKRTVKNEPKTRTNLTKKQKAQLKKKQLRSESAQDRNRRLAEAKLASQSKIKEAQAVKSAPEVIEEKTDSKHVESAVIGEKHWTRSITSSKDSVRNLSFKSKHRYKKLILKGAVTLLTVATFLSIAGTRSGDYEVSSVPEATAQVEVVIAEPTATVAPIVTASPTVAPTATAAPTAKPTVAPIATAAPTAKPTVAPTATAAPTAKPTETPTVTATPTAKPTVAPTATATPTAKPTVAPTATAAPTAKPTVAPTATMAPTAKPTVAPTVTATPTEKPAEAPVISEKPTEKPVLEKQVEAKAPTPAPEIEKSNDEKLEEFRQMAVQKYMEEFTIGHKPSVGDILDSEKYYQNPEGTGNYGYFKAFPDRSVGFINLISNSGWETVTLEGKSLPELLAEHPECVDYNISFTDSKTGIGLGFITKGQLENVINQKVESIIESKQQEILNKTIEDDFYR